MSNSERPISVGMENNLQREYPILDKGFIRVVDYMGNDEAIEQAARVSYGTGTKGKSSLGSLINYLMEHHHTTPFEMCEVKLHVKLPVFVARQWIRHRTANVNEYSARYSILDKEFYIPETEQLAPQSKTNGQGRDTSPVAMAANAQMLIRANGDRTYDLYDGLLDPEDGFSVARELSRMVLPANIYTQWYWKVDLHNLFNFLRLRADPHAQKEIRDYADCICGIVRDWCPLAYEAWSNFVYDSETFSRDELDVLRRLVRGSAKVDEIYGGQNLNQRQIAALNKKLDLD